MTANINSMFSMARTDEVYWATGLNDFDNAVPVDGTAIDG